MLAIREKARRNTKSKKTQLAFVPQTFTDEHQSGRAFGQMAAIVALAKPDVKGRTRSE
jgi:hypothetical protein